MAEQRILFINQSSGYLMIDIIRAFEGKFEQRALAAGFINPRNNPLPDSVKVERIITYDRSSTLRRLWTWLVGFVQIWWLVMTRYRDAHLFIVSNPPFATLLPRLCSNSFSLLIYDVYPDALVEYKVLKKGSFVIRFWNKANQRIYPAARAIFTLSEGMKSRIAQYVEPERISVVPVWTDNDFLRPIPKAENVFRQEQGLQDHFLLLYSGNLGKSHELSVLVDLAKALQDDGVFVLIIGGGDQYESLNTRISSSGLSNIRLLPWQPTEALPQTLAAADLGVVSLGREAALLSMPSKTFNLMSVGVPIMAIADPRAALAKLIEKYQMGDHFEPHQVEEMVAFVRKLASSKSEQERLQRHAIEASRDFGPDNALRFIEPYL